MKKLAIKLGEKTFILAIIPGALIVLIIFLPFNIASNVVLAVQLPFLFIQIIGMILYITYIKSEK